MGSDTERAGMNEELELNELQAALSELSYPLTPDEAVDACEGVTLRLADGTTSLADVVGDSTADSFDSAEDLESEIMGLLPREAVGEPYQSEGEG